MIRSLISFLFLLSLTLNVYAVKNILLLNSYHTGYSWTDGITDGIVEAISKRADINLYVEYEDTKRFSDSTSIKFFKDYLLKKYIGYNIDLIITSDNNALDFVIDNILDKKWNAPVVYCGISNYEDYNIKNQNFYGLLETDDWLPIIDAILKIHHHELEYFYFISENSETSKIREKIIKKCFIELDVRTELVLLDDYTVESLLKEVEKIKGKSIIYYPGIGVDSYNNPVISENLGIEIVNQSHVPVYASFMSVIEAGAVGGYIRPSRIHGLKTAEIALKLLDSAEMNTIPKINSQAGEFVLDFNMIEKLNLNIQDIPHGVLIINKPKNIFETYKREVFIILAFILILIMIIALLISNIFKRTRAERRYKESESRFREFAELLPQVVFEIDINGNFLFLNNHGLEIFGYSKEEFINGIT